MTWAPPYDFAPGPPFARSITGPYVHLLIRRFPVGVRQRLNVNHCSTVNFSIADALVVPHFFDDRNTLLHAVNISEFENFVEVEIPVAPKRDRVDVLIG